MVGRRSSVVGLLIVGGALAAGPCRGDVAALQAALDGATAAVRRHSMVGVVVRSVTRGDTLYRREAEHLFVPASNQKLLTSAAALDRLGPGYRFATRVLTTGERSADGTLRGDLVLQGGGDPVLATTDLEALARSVAESGIRRVTGSLRADDSRFDAARLGRAWSSGDEPFYYSAQISALSVNRNTVTVRVEPGPRPGWPAHVTLEPATSYVQLLNRGRTAPAGTPAEIEIDRERAQNRIRVRGAIPVAGAAVTEAITVEHPTLYTASLFRDALRRAGAVVEGTTVWLRAPRTARLLVSHESPPMEEVLRLLNQPSDNLIAEMLLKTLGVERAGAGTARAGTAEVVAFVRDLQLDAAPIAITDGSGLSRLNLVTPDTLCGILEAMARHRDGETFRRSLPVAGVNGTLRRRMRDTPAANNARAKTGTLTGVTALSGYVTARNGELLVFSLMTNNYPGYPDLASLPRQMEDAVCVALAEFSR